MIRGIWEPLLTAGVDELPLTFVDLETTGLSPHFGDRICEVGIVQCRGEREVERFTTLVNPRRRISPGAAAVNGITAEMVREAPEFSEIADRVGRLLSTGIAVAHNAPFDLSFLAEELSLAGVPLPDSLVIDTLAIARRCFSFPSNSLGNVAEGLGIVGGGHRALMDALTTRAVFDRFVQLLSLRVAPLTLSGLIELQGGEIRWPTPRRGIEVPLPPGLGELVRDGRRVRLSYQSAGGIRTERLVDPRQLVVRDGAAYLIAYCHLRQEQRTFKIDRIVGWESS